ncbi:MAG: RNA methyltransferase, partial [Bacteroidales bacterium]|nr:RNA methyltransferase [Bacteroidales bacterium]
MRYIAKTLYGFEQILADELLAIGVKKVKPINRAVIFWGNKETLYKVNYASRIALSVLEPIADFSITSKQDLYDRCMEIDWSEYMDVDNSFSVVPVVNSRLFPHTGYPALVVKDAIADYFRNKCGRRPSVNLTDSDLVVNLHISNSKVDMSIDSTVIPLYKRG